MPRALGESGSWNRFLHVYQLPNGTTEVRTSPDGPADQLVATVRVGLSVHDVILTLPPRREVRVWEDIAKRGSLQAGYTIASGRAALASTLVANFTPSEFSHADTPSLRAAYADAVKVFAAGATTSSTAIWPGFLRTISCWMWTLLPVLVVAAAVNRLWYRAYPRRGRRRLESKLCPHCAYPADAESDLCPECGVSRKKWRHEIGMTWLNTVDVDR